MYVGVHVYAEDEGANEFEVKISAESHEGSMDAKRLGTFSSTLCATVQP